MTLVPVGSGQHAAKWALWDAFCRAHAVAEASALLLDADGEGKVEVIGYGRNRRPMLRRAPVMEALLAGAADQVLTMLGGMPGNYGRL